MQTEKEQGAPLTGGPVDRSVRPHTPGPWIAKFSPGAGLGIWADLRPALGERHSKDFPLIGNESLPVPKVQIAYETWVQFPSDQWEAMQKANMHLMAAAPDLLEALQYAVEQVPELATVPGIATALAKALGPNANVTGLAPEGD